MTPKPRFGELRTSITNGKNLTRAFAQFIMDPIISIARASIQNDKVKLKSICEKMDVYLTPEEWEYTFKELNKCI
jgi:hypothetical protein